jgi:transposase-like protein
MRVRGAEVEAKWRGLISEQEQSGKTVAEFCRERGIASSKLYSWKERCVGAKAAAGFVQVRVAPAVEAETVASAGSRIEVRLAGGRSLVVEPGFDASHLRALLAVLESRPS